MVFAVLRRHAIAFVAVFLLLSGSAYAVVGQVGRGARNKQFYACVAGDYHTLNLTTAGRKCPSGQTKISWNAAGRRGVAGPRGHTGRTGARGATGDPGASGTNGAVGPRGDAGAAGATGPQGSPGSKGDTGDAGPRGVAGHRGHTGRTGARGAAGEAGTNGTDGAVGPTGDTGAAGATGPQGRRGPKGETGGVGPVGPIGAKGDTGATGPPVTSSYGFATDSSTARGPNILRPGHPVPFSGFNGTGVTADRSRTSFTVSHSGLYELDFLGSSQTDVFYAIEVNGVALQPQVEAKHGQVLVQQLPSLSMGDVLRIVPESRVGVISHATFRILRVGS
jgi:Collagen triple helix repeat (20 copies)